MHFHEWNKLNFNWTFICIQPPSAGGGASAAGAASAGGASADGASAGGASAGFPVSMVDVFWWIQL